MRNATLFFGATNGAIADYDWDGTNDLSIDASQPVGDLSKLGAEVRRCRIGFPAARTRGG